jgi:hypothetical protein
LSIALVHVSDDLDFHYFRPCLIHLRTIAEQARVGNHSVLKEVVIRLLGHVFVPISEPLPFGSPSTDPLLHFGKQLKPSPPRGQVSPYRTRKQVATAPRSLEAPTGAHRLNSYPCLTGDIAIKIGIAGAMTEVAASACPGTEDQNAPHSFAAGRDFYQLTIANASVDFVVWTRNDTPH